MSSSHTFNTQCEASNAMKSIGGLMFFLGLGSFLLHFANREFRLLSWVDNWGPTIGNAIRIGLIVVGAALWFVAHKQEKQLEG
jgi:hypothetical protein